MNAAESVDLKRSYSRKRETRTKLEPPTGFAEGAIVSRQKSLRKKNLTSQTIQLIIDEVMVNKTSYEETAIKFKVRWNLVLRLVKAFKKDCGFVQAVREREELRASKLSQVIQAVNDIIATQKNLWRTSQVVELVQ